MAPKKAAVTDAKTEAKKPVETKAVAEKPVEEKVAAEKAAETVKEVKAPAKKTAAKKPAEKKTAEKKPVAKKPAAKKPAAKRPEQGVLGTRRRDRQRRSLVIGFESPACEPGFFYFCWSIDDERLFKCGACSDLKHIDVPGIHKHVIKKAEGFAIM